MTKQELQKQIDEMNTQISKMNQALNNLMAETKDDEFDLAREIVKIENEDHDSVGSYWIVLDGDVNNFRTTDEAIKFENQIKALRVLQLIASYYNKDWKPSWNDDVESKYIIYKDYEINSIDIDETGHMNIPFGVYFRNENDCKKAIELMKEYGLLQYLFI